MAMSVIGNILQEELERLENLKQLYQSNIEELPKGSIQIKNINSKSYPYLLYRNKNHVHTKYLGKLNQKELDSLQDSLSKRKEYASSLRHVKNQIMKLRKMLNVERI
jgi:hypothetical protein